MLSYLILFLSIYFLCLAYSLYKIAYPKLCPYDKTSEPNAYLSCFEPIYATGSHVDVHLYVSTDSRPPASDQYVWSVKDITLDTAYRERISISLPSTVRRSGHTLQYWLTITKAQPQEDIEVYNKNVDREMRHSRVVINGTLTSALPYTTNQHRNLLKSQPMGTSIDKDTQNTTSTYMTDVAINTRTNNVIHWKYGIHPLRFYVLNFDGKTLATTTLEGLGKRLFTRVQYDRDLNRHMARYEPLVLIDDSSLMRRQQIPIARNTSKADPSIDIHLSPASPLYFTLKSLLGHLIDMASKFVGENEAEELKYWLSEEKMYSLLLAQVIGFVSITLEYLAFAGDWKFFTGRRNFVGISSTSIGLSVFKSLIIFLYLLDADTSYIVLIGVGKDVLWNGWKLIKVCFSYDKSAKKLTLPVEDVHSCNNDNDSDKDICAQHDVVKAEANVIERKREDLTLYYDHIAFLHMGMAVFPLVIGTALYSISYSKHKSWWSWIIGSLADAVYFLGFVSMTPQLYINFKLKSVAHLPVSSMMYKIFNTFIDDVFAFMVKMPWKHRIMTFRDDVIFLGFIYQWWVYRVDKTRTNEFGFQYEDKDEQNRGGGKDQTIPDATESKKER